MGGSTSERPGLTIHVEENHTAPVVAIQIWVKVGAADERRDEAGIAHLHEHMLFKGTRTRGPGEAARAVEEAGGEINAWTSFDQTVYQVTIASRFWRTGLAVLGDAVSAAAFDPVELSREIEVVCEEINRAEDSPGRAVSEALFDVAYEEHPYGLPVTGTEMSLRSHARETILRFYRRWYRPDNMVLVVVGDVREVEVRQAAPGFFHFDRVDEPPGQRSFAREPREVEPEHNEPRARVERRQTNAAHLTLAFPGPPLGHDDLPALDALSIVLGHGESSRLFRSMKRDRPLVNELHASCYAPQDPGLVMLSFTLPPENLREAVREAAAQVERLRVEDVAPVEWQRACRQLESDAIHRRETVQGRASRLGLLLCSAGGLEQERAYFARLAATTPRLAHEAALRWLDPRRMVGAAVLQADADDSFEFQSFQELLEELAGEAASEERAPATVEEVPTASPGHAPSAREKPAPRAGNTEVGPLIREKLPGGGLLLIREERAVPLVALRAAWSGGQRAETSAEGGAQTLLARLAGKGTATRGAEQIAEQMEELGGSIGGNVGRNSFSLRAEALSRQFSPAWGLFAEAITDPSFRPVEVERELAQQREELRARRDDAAGATFQLFVETLYREHPYRLDMLGSQESLGQLDGAKLAAIRARLYPAGAPVIAVVGDVDPAEVRARVLESLGHPGAIQERLAPPREPAQTQPRAATRAHDKAQAHLVVGYPGISMSDPDCAGLEVLSAILSGPTGRLSLELRDKRRLAHRVGAFSMDGIDPGWFAVYVGCDPDKVREALSGVRGLLQRACEEAPNLVELDRARTRLIGSQAIGLQRGSARAAQLALDACHGLGAEWSRDYPERISAVTTEEVRTLARRLLVPERETVALSAPQTALPAELLERAEERSGTRGRGHV